METKDVILELRTKKGLSQEELAEKVFVTRQAVSRWENGDTVPNIETLKLLSKFFDVSINTLLGSPHKLVCKCCGMNLEDSDISKEPNGNFNEEYCKWCYSDGDYTLDFWKQYINVGGIEKFDEFKKKLIDEFNILLKIEAKNVKTQEQQTLTVDGVFPYIGIVPNVDLINGQIQQNEQGFIVTDEYLATSESGVYAIGDVRTTPLRQVITAAADGAVAAVSAIKYLEKIDTEVTV